MGVAALQPRDCFTRTILTPPQPYNKPSPNRRRRSLPPHHPTISPPPESSTFIPKGSKKKNLNHNNNNVRISKRREEIGKKIPDLRSIRQIGSDPEMIPTQNRVSNRKSTPDLFYAGPVTSTSPPPSEVPLPAFFAKKTTSLSKSSDATNDLIRILRLNSV